MEEQEKPGMIPGTKHQARFYEFLFLLMMVYILCWLAGCASSTRVVVKGGKVAVPIKGFSTVGGEDLVTYIERDWSFLMPKNISETEK